MAPKELWASPGKFRLVILDELAEVPDDLGQYDSFELAVERGNSESRTLFGEMLVIDDCGKSTLVRSMGETITLDKVFRDPSEHPEPAKDDFSGIAYMRELNDLTLPDTAEGALELALRLEAEAREHERLKRYGPALWAGNKAERFFAAAAVLESAKA